MAEFEVEFPWIVDPPIRFGGKSPGRIRHAGHIVTEPFVNGGTLADYATALWAMSDTGLTAWLANEAAALLAHHHEEAGDALAAARWHRRAAEWAGITNAAEGLRHWERVRSLVRTLPHSSGTLELGATACWRALSLGWRLGIPITEAAGIFEEGRELAEQSRDVRTLSNEHGARCRSAHNRAKRRDPGRGPWPGFPGRPEVRVESRKIPA